MLEQVIAILSDYTDTPAEKITGDSRVMGDLGISSVDLIFLMGRLEDEFSVTIDETATQDLQTVKDVVRLVESLAAVKA